MTVEEQQAAATETEGNPFENANFNPSQEEVSTALGNIPNDGSNPPVDEPGAEGSQSSTTENEGGNPPTKDTTTDPQGSQSNPDGTGEESSGQGNDKPDETSQASQQQSASGNLDFSSISEEAGVEVTSREEIINLLKSSKTLQDRVAQLENNPFQNLRPELQAAINYLSKDENRTIAEFAQITGIDAENLDDKTAIQKKWMMDNKSMVQKNPEFAQRSFEKYFKATYGGPNMPDFVDDDYETADEKREAWTKANQDDVDFTKSQLKYDAEEARDFLKKQRDEALQVPEKIEQTDNSQELVESYRQSALKEFESFPKSVTIKVDDNAAHDFKLDLSEVINQNKDLVVNDPLQGAAKMGVDLKKDQIDTTRLNEVLYRDAMWDKIPKILFNHFMTLTDLETIQKKIENPQDTSTSASQRNDSIPFGEKLAQAAEAHREAERKGMR